MKNHYQQKLKQTARRIHQRASRELPYQDGMIVRYFYPEYAPDGIAPWADIEFIINDYQLALTFVTPKTAYKHQVLDDEKSGQVTSADFHIKPSMTIHWLRYARYVNLCAPVVLRNLHDVKALVTLVRKLLNRQTTLEQQFPGYRYNSEDWLKDVG